MSDEQIDVLFVCTHNAGRSVAAKTLFNDRARKLGINLRAESAGTAPGECVNPTIQSVLTSFRLDTSNEKPKSISDEMFAGKPRIITMGCEVDAESCPAINMTDVDDWALPDPSRMSDEEEVVALIHEVARRVNTLIQEMTRDSATSE